MAQWGTSDAASNSPFEAVGAFNVPANSTNRTALFGNTTADAFITGQTIGLFGVNTGELTGHVLSISVTANGSGLTDNVGVVIDASPTLNATATATAQLVEALVANAGVGADVGDVLTIDSTGGTNTVAASVNTTATQIVTATATGIGSGYTNGDIVTIANGVTSVNVALVVTTFAANTSVSTLAVSNGGVFTTNPTLNAVATSNVTGSGTGLTVNVAVGIQNVAIVNVGNYTVVPTELANNTPTGGGTGPELQLSFGVLAITVTNDGNNYSTTPGVTLAGTGLTGAYAKAIMSESGVAHTGWNLRKVGSGGRAGRVQWETLVAGGIGTDASDDAVLPE